MYGNLHLLSSHLAVAYDFLLLAPAHPGPRVQHWRAAEGVVRSLHGEGPVRSGVLVVVLGGGADGGVGVVVGGGLVGASGVEVEIA